MAQKQRADKQKEKEKREKIILGALVGVLVIVGAFELPKMLGKSSGNSAGTTAQTTSASSGVTSAGTTVASGAAIGPSTVGSLPNPSTYQPRAGQLSEFSLFNGKDPFGNVSTASSGSTMSTSTTTSTSTSTKTTSTKTNTTATTPISYVAAKISTNGTSEAVPLNGTFPAVSPAFVLNSFDAKQIKISVNGGSFASGQGKVTIKKGKSVVLVNTVDSIRYVIKYVAPMDSKELAAWPAGTTTIATPTATTPGTTTATTSATTTATTTG